MKSKFMLQIAAGGLLGKGERDFLIPVTAISSVSSNRVVVDQTLDRIVISPAYDPKLTEICDHDY
jgi:hypothetical protein